MNKKITKIICMVLSISIILSLFPANVFAADSKQFSGDISFEGESTTSPSTTDESENTPEPSQTIDPSQSPKPTESLEPSLSLEQYLSDEELLSLKLLPYEEEKFIDCQDNNDGSKTVKLYSEPIKFQNGNGEWEYIDNSIVATNSKQESKYQYTNKASDVEVLISDNLDQSDAIKVQYKGYAIGFKPLDILKENGKSTGEIGFIRNDTARTEDETLNSSKKYETLKFSNTFNEDTDIKVIPSSKGVKENIILNEIPNETEFSYELTVENVTPRLREDGNLYFVDEENGILVAMISLPFMYDSAFEQNESFEIKVLLTKTGDDTYKYTMIPDRSFLEDKNTVYPVIIDPSVETLTSGSISDTFVASKSTYANTNFNGNTHLRLGYGPTYSISRGLVKVNTMPTELQGKNIISAKYHAYQDYEGDSSPTMEVHKITSNWTPATVTWNSGRPAFSSTITDDTLVDNIEWSTWDVTSLALDGSLTTCSLVNYGICIKNDNEALNMYKRFRAQEYTDTTPYNINYFEFIYTTPVPSTELDKNIGMKSYQKFPEFSTQSGTGYINPSSGNLYYTTTDVSIQSPAGGLSFTRSYNSQFNYAATLGQGWDHSYNITLQKESDLDMVLKLGNGNMYRFDYNNGSYVAPNGLFADLTLSGTAPNQYYLLKFNTDTEYWFDYKSGLITKIINRLGNWIEFNYNDKLLLETVEDIVGNTLAITYSTIAGEKDLIKTVTCSGKTYTYLYNSSRQLIREYITNGTQQVGEQYAYTGGVITTITNLNGYDYDIEYNTDINKKVIGVTNPLNQEMTISYSIDNGYILLTTLLNHITQKYWYDSNSLVLKQEQFENESPRIYSYNSNYMLANTIQPNESSTDITYTANGFTDTVTKKDSDDVTQQVTNYDYGTSNLDSVVTKVTESVSSTVDKKTEYAYNSNGTLNKEYVEMRNNGSLPTGINAQGFSVIPDSAIYYDDYDQYGNPGTKTIKIFDTTSSEEKVFIAITSYDYDTKARLIKTTNSDNTFVSQTYDSYGNIGTVTDARGNVTKYYYNILGQKIQETTAYGTTEATSVFYTYDNLGNILTETDAKGYITTYTYDALGRQTRVDYEDDTYETTTYTVRTDGTQLQVHTDGAGNQTITVTDKKEQTILEGIIGAVGTGTHNTVSNTAVYEDIYDDNALITFTVSEYDVMGNVVSTTDNTGVVTTNVYNDMNQMTSTTTSNGTLSSTITYTYDDMGNTLTENTPEANTTKTYDLDGRVLTETKSKSGLSSTTSYNYDEVELDGSVYVLRMIVTDPLGRQKTLQYDKNIRLVKEFFGGRTTVYTYDANGNMLTSTLTNTNFPSQSAVTSYIYDKHNRKTRATYKVNDQYVTYVYDNNNNITQEKLYKNNALASTTDYTYDVMNNQTEVKLNSVTTVMYTYTENGTSESIKYGSGTSDRKIGYVYDEAGNIIQVHDWTNGGDTAIRDYYYENGLLEHIVDKRGTDDAKQEFTYDDLGRLETVKYYGIDDETVLEEYALTYNTDSTLGAMNQIATETTTTRYGGTPVTASKSYEYDGLGRLESETVNSAETSYTYDLAGNRLTMTQGTNEYEYTYNDYDQLTEIKINNLIQTTYGYDLSGNQITKTEGTTVDRYYFDDANWLETVTRQIGQNPVVTLAEYVYDAEGQRTRKTVNGVYTNYFYSGLCMLYTKDGSGSIIEQIVYDPDGNLVNSRRVSGSDYWVRLDNRGSVTNIVDVDDNVLMSYTYDAYGNTSSAGTFVNSFAYTGAVIDAETGLYYMNARYYDPESGRFISEDTYRGDGEAFWHLYAYCNGDPVNFTDPTGHIADEGCNGGGNTGGNTGTKKDDKKKTTAPVWKYVTVRITGNAYSWLGKVIFSITQNATFKYNGQEVKCTDKNGYYICYAFTWDATQWYRNEEYVKTTREFNKGYVEYLCVRSSGVFSQFLLTKVVDIRVDNWRAGVYVGCNKDGKTIKGAMDF